MLIPLRWTAVPAGLASSVLLLAGCANETTPTSATVPAPPPPPASAPPAPAASEKPLGAFTVTCHTGSGTTASGRPSGPGVAAVDTDVLPLGTRLRVEKVGTVVAADRGGAVDEKSVDVWLPSEQECTDFGRQQLQVWRLG